MVLRGKGGGIRYGGRSDLAAIPNQQSRDFRSTIARAIRDRIDVVRRASSQSVETQASVVGILAITYGLALLMWNQYPERVEKFAVSEIGRFFIGFSIGLQAIGLLWISRMTRVEV